ncbi:hypothetical protein [Allorhizobium borbori]|uniref:Uncharacterized protein n=1 Tax=Allorhizobium borbori TaxID=485907 RepID=A0A7W6K2S3_9HYPH|nr:hypothetical protein [Allorhizobium borbori]MBB4103040.1 hypothetical protein [Allorhizobium borbori]
MHKTNQKADDKIIRDMADTMRRYGEGMPRETLLLHFTQEEVSRFETKARDLAMQLSSRAAA